MKRQFSKYAVERRATRRSQDAADDAFYAEQARKRREAEAQAQPLTRYAAGRDGECGHAQCPQLRDSEPTASGRHCPLDNSTED